jgi:hypothetical protein
MSCEVETNEYVAVSDEELEQEDNSAKVLFELLKLLGMII